MTQTASILPSLSIALLAGLLLSRLAKRAQLPAVTAYLVSGILIGPFVLGALQIPGIGITAEQLEGFGIISDLALGFIAFAMGNEFRLSQLKKIGKQATVIGVFQAVFTTVVVDAVLIGLHFVMPEALPLPVAIVLASVATATAPAATLMVVKQYKSKGPVTDILLPVVALDDAVGISLFAHHHICNFFGCCFDCFAFTIEEGLRSDVYNGVFADLAKELVVCGPAFQVVGFAWKPSNKELLRCSHRAW